MRAREGLSIPTPIIGRLVLMATVACAVLASMPAKIGAAQQGDPPGSMPHDSDPRFGAEPRSAATLYDICLAEASRPLNWCEGYLLGLADVLVAMGNSHMDGGICNAEYAPATLGRVFKAWVERHPEKSQEDMMIAAQAAFHQLWPCK